MSKRRHLPKVSVLVITYNQERFIVQALQSVLMQEVNFEYEVVIGEDCSTDRTREIVLQFQKEHPLLVRVILHDKNQGPELNFIQTLQACRGKYVATLEGDDYWTSPHKLRIMVDFLEAHPEFSECFHLVEVVRENEDKEADFFPGPVGVRGIFPVKDPAKDVFHLEDLLTSNIVATSSAMFHSKVRDRLPAWFFTNQVKVRDWALVILNAAQGRIGLIKEVMGVYRIHREGIWSRTDAVGRIKETITMLQLIDAHLGFQYHKALENTVSQLRSRLALEQARDPMSTLLQIYWRRPDLQAVFPEAKSGEYQRLTEWAGSVVASRANDVHLNWLLRHADWFARTPWRSVSELEKENAQLASELDAIHRSPIFRVMSSFTRRIDKLLPDGTRRGEFRKIIVQSTHIVLDEGFTPLVRQMREKIAKREFRIMEPTALGASSTEMTYEKLLAGDELDQERVEKIKEDIATFKLTPKVSIITPTYNTPIQQLRTTLESVGDQLYGNWELCVCDDASDDAVWELLTAYERKDARIKLARMKGNSGTAKASNEALKLATGEFVALLDHDDVLTRDALYEFVRAINTEPAADVIYSDEDKITEDGRYHDPFFKPDWSPELLRTIPYISHLTVIRRSLIENAGGFREEFRDTPDYDLQLRTTDLARKVVHIPRVLYHWRAASTSVSNPENRTKFERLYKENLAELQLFATSKKMGPAETWTHPNTFHIAYTIKGKPRVTIVILTYDKVDLLRNCLKSIEKSSYPHKEIIIVTNNVDKRSEMWGHLRTLPHKVITFEAEFNWSAMNNRAAEVASGDYLLFLNDDTEVKNSDWIERLLEYAQQPDVGAVGCRLILPHGRCQHAGVTSDPVYIARHQFKDVAGDGYYSMTVLSREVSAVTGACMITRTQVFQQLHGFDTALRHLYNDIDYCWRLRDLGYRIIYAATVTLLHHEGGSRYGKVRQRKNRYHNDPSEMQDIQHMFRRWRGKMLNGDPYFNYNLSNVGIDLFLMRKSFYPAQQPTSPSGAILLLSHNLNLEGSTLGLFNIGRYLREIGYVVTVVSPHDGKLRRRYVENGISVLIIPDLGHLCSRGDEDLRAFMASYDLIFANTILMFFVIPFVRARSYPAMPRIVWLIRESPEIDAFCREMRTGTNTLTYCFANADKVVFLCQATLDLYAQFNTKGNFQVINDSVDWDEYQKLAKSPGLHLDKSFFNVLTVGTIYPGKGQDSLIEAALDLLARKEQNFKFYIVGKVGNEEFFKKLRSLVASRQLNDRIIFTGQLNRREVISYYTECQAFVLPSRRESFPTSVVEAMAAGKPIIATRVFGIMEQLQHNYSGLLIEPGDKTSLVESLLRLYNDPALAATLGENARREFISRFTLRAMTEKYQQLVQSLTSDTSRPSLPTVTAS